MATFSRDYPNIKAGWLFGFDETNVVGFMDAYLSDGELEYIQSIKTLTFAVAIKFIDVSLIPESLETMDGVVEIMIENGHYQMGLYITKNVLDKLGDETGNVFENISF